MIPAQPPISIAALAGMIQAVQAAGRPLRGESPAPLNTSWASIPRRALHEWFAQAPPQTLMIDLAIRAARDGPGGVFWIGRVCWPYPPALRDGSAAAVNLLGRSVFVDLPPRDRSGRVWAIDLVLRSGAAVAVIADGRGLDTAESRRLQLAAEAGPALAMLWRKEEEVRALSVAHHRWRVRPACTTDRHPRWWVQRLRCKDAAAWRQGSPANTHLLEYRRAEGVVAISADVVDRSHAPTIAPTAQRTA